MSVNTASCTLPSSHPRIPFPSFFLNKVPNLLSIGRNKVSEDFIVLFCKNQCSNFRNFRNFINFRSRILRVRLSLFRPMHLSLKRVFLFMIVLILMEYSVDRFSIFASMIGIKLTPIGSSSEDIPSKNMCQPLQVLCRPLVMQRLRRNSNKPQKKGILLLTLVLSFPTLDFLPSVSRSDVCKIGILKF